MKPAPFEYHRPSTAADAVALLVEHGEGAKVLAGGQSLVAMLALRLAVFDHLVDIGRITELSGIEQRDGELWIGAGTTQTDIERSPVVAAAAPLLTLATPLIGHFQIRNRGTLGGSIAHADPAAEYPAVALTLDATMHVLSADGVRTIAAGDLFEGVWTTTIADDELLVGVTFPIWAGRCGFAIEEVARRHGDFAIAGATAAVELDGEDRVARAAIGLLGLGPAPSRATTAEATTTGRRRDEIDPDELGRIAVADLGSAPSDLHGSEVYRRRVGAVMVSRAWTKAVEEAARA